MNGLGGRFWPLERPAAWVPLLVGVTSITSLLLYFFGITSLGQAVQWTLLPAVLFLGFFVGWRSRAGDTELTNRIVAGLWAGVLATLAYDLVRVPISASGIPVFKAISYFGTLMLDEVRPSLSSEILGWSYHASNGMGFGLMYAVAVAAPRLWTALAWGLTLEAVMLLTPYVEVLGYQASPVFLTMTIGSHLVYGATLWAALAIWERMRDRSYRRWMRLMLLVSAVMGIATISADTFDRHAASIPPSPPSYIGKHLYATWNVPEPDRVALLWIIRRFVDPAARFHFVEPFSRIDFGNPIDIPEAEVRRSGTRSATQVLLDERGLDHDPQLRALGEMTYLFEIARWRLPAHPAAHELGLQLMAAVDPCERPEVKSCFERGMSFLDDWYDSGQPAGGLGRRH